MKKTILYLFLFSLILTGVNLAHGDKKHKKSRDTVTVVNGDTIAVNGVMVNDSLALAKETLEHNTEEPKDFEFTIQDALLEHIHNKIIHFPIVLIVMAFFFSLFQFKYQKFDHAIKVMVLLAVLFSVIAFITGTNQMEPFEKTAKDWLVHLHRTFGIITFFTTVVWSIFLFAKKLKKYAWLIATLAFIIVSITGFLGGVLAH